MGPLHRYRAPYDDGRQADDVNQRLAEISHRIDQLTGSVRQAGWNGAAPAYNDVPAYLRQLDANLQSLSAAQSQQPAFAAGAPAWGAAPGGDGLQNAIDQIAQTQDILNGNAPARRPEPAHPDPMTADMNHQLRALSDSIESLRRDREMSVMDDLKRDIAQIRADIRGRGQADPYPADRYRGEQFYGDRRQQPDRRGTPPYDRPSPVLGADYGTTDTLRRDISDLRHAIGRQNVGGSLKSLEGAYQHIVERLDLLTRALGEAGTMSTIGQRLSEIRSAVSSGPQMTHIDTLATRIAAISDQLNRISADADNDQLRAIDQRIRDIQDRLEHVDSGTDKTFAQNKIRELGDRISAQIGELSRLQAAPRNAPELDAIDRRLSDIAGRMANLERSPAATVDLGIVESAIEDVARTAEARLSRIADANASLPELERQVRAIGDKIETLVPSVYERWDSMEASLGRIDEAVSANTGKDGLAAIEAALKSLVDRLDRDANMAGPDMDIVGLQDELRGLRTDLRTLSPIDGERIDQQIQTIGEKIDTLSQPEDDRWTAIEASLARIDGRLSRPGSGDDGRSAPADDRWDAIESSLARIDSALARGGVSDAANPALDDRWEAIEASLGRIHSTLSRDGENEGLARLEARFAALSESLNRQPAMAVSGDIGGVRQELSDLRAAVDALPSVENARMDREFVDLSAQLRNEMNDLRQAVDAIPRVDGAGLERTIADLSAQVRHALDGETNDGVLEAIEQRLADVTRNVNTATEPAPEIATIGAAVERMAESLDHYRSLASEMAQNAAQETAREFAEFRGSGIDPREIQALQDELRQLQAAAQASERETRGGFEALHDTLQTITTRLETLDSLPGPVTTDAVPMAAAAVSSGAEPAPARPIAASSASDGDRPGPSLPENPATSLLDNALAAKRSPEREPEEDAEPPENHRPLAPGSGRPNLSRPVPVPKSAAGQKFTPMRQSAPAQPPQRVAAAAHAEPQGPTGDQAESADPAAGRQSDFIAAARRAAQAATAEAAQTDLQEKPGRRSWLADRLKRKPAEEPAAVAATPEEAPDEAGVAPPEPEDIEARSEAGTSDSFLRRRRPLLLAAAVVVIAVGALQVYKVMNRPDDRMAMADSAIEHMSAAPETKPMATEPMTAPEATPPVRMAEPMAGTADEADGQSSEPAGTQAPSADSDVAFDPTISAQAGFSAPRIEDSNVMTAAPETAVSTAQPAAAPEQAFPSLPDDFGTERLRSLAAAGDPAAQFEVAARYMDGRGIAPNMAEAARWYQFAAETGLAPAQYRLASLYEKGQGVAKDTKTALEWYKRAAEQGNAKSMHNLAVLHAEGIDGKQDFENAARWFKQAANLNVRDSQFNLGILYARGFGVQQDLATSYKWFAVAANNGDQDSARKRDEIANALDRTALANARLAAETWKPKTPIESANTVSTPPGGWQDAPARSASAPVGETKALVAKAQSLLTRLGYRPGPADGVIGPRTREAVRAFQRKEGMSETGQIDLQLVEALSGRAI